MKLFATGKWLKEEKRWRMVVAMDRHSEAAAPPQRKPLKRAEVIALSVLRKRYDVN